MYLKEFNIVSCYISPNIRLESYKKTIENIFGEITAAPNEFIIVEDINAKSPLWGANLVDSKGLICEEHIAARNMTVLNNGDTPTFVRNNSFSYSDVNIATQNLSKKISNWTVLDAETLSHHKFIYFEIGNLTYKTNKNYGRQNCYDWVAFRDELTLRLGNRTDWELDEINNLIKELTRNNMMRDGNGNKITQPYWTEEITEKRAECNKKLRKYY